MLQKLKGGAISSPGVDVGRYGRGKQYKRIGTNSESHLPKLTRDPAVQSEADAELHRKAKNEMRRWLREQGATLTTLLKKKKKRR